MKMLLINEFETVTPGLASPFHTRLIAREPGLVVTYKSRKDYIVLFTN